VTGRRTSVAFTYSVQWKEIKQFNGNRWDAFLLKPNPERHYYSLLNSTIVVLLVAGVLIVIFFKTMVHSTKENATTEDKVREVLKLTHLSSN
jgi:transmembrane 9 superfamily protein 2/4